MASPFMCQEFLQNDLESRKSKAMLDRFRESYYVSVFNMFSCAIEWVHVTWCIPASSRRQLRPLSVFRSGLPVNVSVLTDLQLTGLAVRYRMKMAIQDKFKIWWQKYHSCHVPTEAAILYLELSSYTRMNGFSGSLYIKSTLIYLMVHSTNHTDR